MQHQKKYYPSHSTTTNSYPLSKLQFLPTPTPYTPKLSTIFYFGGYESFHKCKSEKWNLCEDNFGREEEFTKGAHPFDSSEGKVEKLGSR